MTARAGVVVVGPVQPDQRETRIDIIRGFALLGILIANWSEWGVKLLSDLISMLVEGSFYPMYAFLFGLGFALQLIRAEEAGRPFVARYLWRTLLLFGIGTVHYLFISSVDILRVYAVAALLLLIVRRLRPRLLLALATSLLLVSVSPINTYLVPGHVGSRVDLEGAGAESLQESQRMWQSQAAVSRIVDRVPGLSARYRDELGLRVNSWLRWPSTVTTLRWWKNEADVLCMFVVGLWAGRRGILRAPERHVRLLAWVAAIGLVVGLAGNAIGTFEDALKELGIAIPDGWWTRWSLDYTLGNIGLTFFYISTLLLLMVRTRLVTGILKTLAPAGRMGLTNYLVQSIVFSILMWRGSVAGVRLGGWAHLWLLLLFFAVQLLYSRWWFSRFRFGPAEWVWRSLTWWQRQPMRTGPPIAPPALADTAAG